MFPFWELAVAPLLDACECRRVVEIGALRGENTVQMLDRLGPGTELHVIDPVPDFDPAEHEARFGGRYVFHGDLSLNVLPHLPPMDAALIDGDHNWYTVYHELGALTKVARDAGAPLPLMILHDVLWPYGRRDLYYGPDTIPEEFRQPHDQRGMSPDKKRLLNAGGMNAQLHNAVEEGGPRNGVMTGLEDWMAEHDKPLRRVVLPIYFGLAIVVEEERLARQPQLAAVLDHLESAAGRGQLLELSEDIRLRAAVFQQSVFAMRERQVDAGAHRYLNLLKGALLDEHYIENELRIQQLVRHLEEGSRPSPIQMADPLRLLRRDAEVLTALRHAGRLRDESDQLVSYFPWTTMGRVRIDHLEQALDLVRTGNVPGDLVECGTGRGGGAIFLRGYLEAYFMARPTVWVVDAFRGSPRSDTGAPLNDDRELPVPGGGAGFPFLQADLNMVRDGFARFDLLDDRVRFVEGDLDQTLPSAPIDQIALLRIGDDLGPSVADVLDRLYDKLAIGGVVVIDDYVDDACRQAVDDFRVRRGVPEPLERVDWAGAWWRKLAEPSVPAGADTTGSATDTADTPVRSSRAVGAPLLEPVPVGQLDLSVVVVFYNMRREAQRTLHSLSRSYQEGIEGLDYEVIVVENGSDPDQRVDEELVRSFGPQFRFIDMGPDAPPSPVFALNRGLAESSGKVVAIMIDGAHVLTPGVLRWGLAGIDLYEPAVVTTQQWYLGPGQQPDMIADGYDQDYEDDLLRQIYWPTNGYRLFEIGHFIGGRDWFDGVWESNCLFVPRKLLEQVGTFDESFVVPGGGFANLELYERLGSTPGVSEVSILGEGSFHQLHGGTTTNVEDAQERRDRISSYFRQFADMRGRGFRGPNKKIHYVGTMFSEAARTRSRRTTAQLFFKKWHPDDPDGRPKTAEPIAEDLKLAYTEAYWRNLGWRKTDWLGLRLNKSPGDLLMYQQIISELRPDWIIEQRTGNGGQALFLASVCELLGHGQVLSVDDREQPDLPEHPRLRYLVMPTHGDETRQAVDEIVGDGHALVVLGTSGSANRMIREFETYYHHVAVGSYVIMENTIVGGHPVWPSFGPGPSEAVKDIIANHHDWVSDPLRERYGLSFNPDGYLKRVR